MTTALAQETRLPAIFSDCCNLVPPFDAPFLADRWIVATDFRVLIRAPADQFDHRLRMTLDEAHPTNAEEVAAIFGRWRPTGAILELPPIREAFAPCGECRARADMVWRCDTCHGAGRVLDRGRVRLDSRIAIAAYWVATLRRHGVRVVEVGEPDELGRPAPVRFECDGGVEGLLMPLREEVR